MLLRFFSFLLGTALAASTAVAADGTAFVATCSEAAGCVIPANRQFNQATHSNSDITFSRTLLGSYSVTIPGLGAGRGNVQVTALGTTSNYCKVASWGPSGSAQRVRVNCFNAAGAAVDSRFTLSYQDFQDGPRVAPAAYLWAHQPTTPSYNANPAYAYNQSGATNTITRSGIGIYSVYIPWLTSGTARAFVTAYGPDAVRCKLAGVTSGATGVTASVRCHKGTAPADSMFTLLYLEQTTATNAELGYGGDYGASGFVPATAAPVTGQWSSITDVSLHPLTSQRLSAGYYKVTIPGGAFASSYASNALVMAHGSGSAWCNVSSWSALAADEVLYVRCFDSAAGTPADSGFSFLLQSDENVHL